LVKDIRLWSLMGEKPGDPGSNPGGAIISTVSPMNRFGT